MTTKKAMPMKKEVFKSWEKMPMKSMPKAMAKQCKKSKMK